MILMRPMTCSRNVLRTTLCTLSLIGTLTAGGLGTQAAAQSSPSPEVLQAARELTSVVSASLIAELNQNLTDQIWPGLEAALRRGNPKVSAAALAELRKEFEQQQLATVLDSMNDVAGIYARHFTIEEMRALAAFYRTPAGAKALATMPRVTVELVKTMQPRLQALQTRIAQAVTRLLHPSAEGASGPGRTTGPAR